jgi:hypothetical protein
VQPTGRAISNGRPPGKALTQAVVRAQQQEIPKFRRAPAGIQRASSGASEHALDAALKASGDGKEDPMDGLKVRVARRVIGLALATATVLLGSGAPNALAATSQTTGTPGAVYYYKVTGFAGAGNYNVYFSVTLPTPYAYRSPATGTNVQQTVYAHYALVNMNTGATLYSPSDPNTWFVKTIPAGAQGVWLPSEVWYPSVAYGASNNFAVVMEIHWHTSTSFLGSRTMIYQQTGDYVCTGGTGCVAGQYLTLFNI